MVILKLNSAIQMGPQSYTSDHKWKMCWVTTRNCRWCKVIVTFAALAAELVHYRLV